MKTLTDSYNPHTIKATKKQIKAANESLKRINLGLEDIGTKGKVILHVFCNDLNPTKDQLYSLDMIRSEIRKAISIEDILWLSEFRSYNSVYNK